MLGNGLVPELKRENQTIISRQQAKQPVMSRITLPAPHTETVTPKWI